MIKNNNNLIYIYLIFKYKMSTFFNFRYITFIKQKLGFSSISINSNKEEISQFFVNNYNITEKVKENIIKENITGEALIYLEDDDYTFLEISPDIKDKIKKYLESNKKNFIEKPIEISIDFDSNKTEVLKFCEKYLSFNGKLNDDIDGKKFLELSEQEMKNLGLNLCQRRKLLKYIKYSSLENYKKELKKFLKEKLNFSDQEIESLNLNGDSFYSFIEKEKIDKLQLSPEEKENYKNILKHLKEKIASSYKNETDNNKNNHESMIKKDTKKKQTGIENQNKLYTQLNFYNVQPLDESSENNLFFILIINEQNINYSYLSIYSIVNSFFGYSGGWFNFNFNFRYLLYHQTRYYNYYFNIINDQRYFNNYGIYRLLMIQVPIEKDTQTIYVEYSLNTFYGYKNYITQIDINKKSTYFFLNNLNYYDNTVYFYYYLTLNNNDIFTYFLNFFFDNKTSIREDLQISLMQSLIDKVNQFYEIKLSPEIIFKYLKYCLKFKLNLFSINAIQLIELSYSNIPKDYYISDEDINEMIINPAQKSILIKKIVNIYFLYDISYLIKLKKSQEFSRAILDLIILKDFNFDGSLFENEESILNFQNDLLLVSKTKIELNYILKLSKGLTKYLKFISDNYEKIYTIIMKESVSFFAFNKANYILTLPKLENDNTIEKINELLNSILEKKNKDDYNIVDIEKILEFFITKYNDKPLNEFCKLKDIVNMCNEKGIILSNTETLYINIHKKGVKLINKKKMTIEEIIQFLYTQDIYYYDEKYKDIREASIFKNISITDPSMKNIQELKKKKVWELFKNSKVTLRIQFYGSILHQINGIKDFQYIFKLFSIENIDKDFNQMIINKIEPMKITDSDRENNSEIIFEIYSNLLICNDRNELELKLYIIPDYEYSSKYLFYLLKNNNLINIISKLKEKIIDYFLKQNEEGNLDEKTLISLLQSSPNNDFSLYLLNKMEHKLITVKQFYQEEEEENFTLFKLFFEKCSNLIQNEEIRNGKYLSESLKIKNKIEDDLSKSKVKYGLMTDLINDDNSFYNKKILLICDRNEQKAQNIYNKIKNDLENCNKLFLKFKKIKDFYITFFQNTKKTIIDSIEKELEKHKQKNIDEILNLNLEEKKIIENNEFNFEEAVKESEDLKYNDSFIFMALYREKNQKGGTEKEIFDSSKKDFINSMTKIIKQNETKEPFFEINNVIEIMNAIKNKEDDELKNEIDFISKEFAELNKDAYIKNNLLDDLVNFSKKDKVERLLQGLIYFIDSNKNLFQFQETEFIKQLKEKYKVISSKGVSGEEIKDSINLLSPLGYDVNKENSLIKFYEIFLGKEDSIKFIKKIKDNELEVRNLNEFIDENENSQLQTTDIDNLLDISNFFKSLANENINTDEEFHKKFKEKFYLEKDIIIKLQGYLSSYGEIIQLFEQYNENPEMTTQKINKILKSSNLEIYKEEKKDFFIFKIKYSSQTEKVIEVDTDQIKELKNKILISSTKTNLLKDDTKNKEELINEFVILIDNINQLINTLDNLIKAGYPDLSNLTLKIENSIAFDPNDKEKDLQKIIDEYKNKNKDFRKIVKEAYKKYPLLRSFYGKQFIQLYEKAKNNKANISHLVNSMTFNKISNFNLEYQYNDNENIIENINTYLENLFSLNNVTLNDIYSKNKILSNLSLEPGLYRIITTEEDSDLAINISNIYINLTGNIPIINSLLICNDETNTEKIKSFLYRAIFCDAPILFLITNIEYLELSIKQSLVKTLNNLFKSKNRIIKSYILFLFKKADSGLLKDIEKLIPEKNILNNFLRKPENSINLFNETETYSSIFAGYGKTTEIKYKVKEKNGKYYYLPLGGVFTRNYIINNLENLNLELKDGKQIFIHLDLSETDNDDLMNELLFKLLILRFIDSNDKIFYLGNDINIIIEIPNGFIDFKSKYSLLTLFRNIHIDKLCPLRLEENIKIVRDSPISIVAETLKLYENDEIATKNIKIDEEIKLNANECEQIINRHFKVENHNYYQKINFIKILSIQFKKFCDNMYFDYDVATQCGKQDVICNVRKCVIKNFIILTEVFARSPYDSILNKKVESLKLFGKKQENKIKEDALISLTNEMKEIFSFDLIKPSLVFFNRDGFSLSIITNITNKENSEYKELHKLWNSQNFNSSDNELIDYKKLNHEEFLKEILALFSLQDEDMNVKDVKLLCENCGNYIFVSDNYIKMVRILLNIEAKIPVILMGETGVGKTKLLEILATLYGKGRAKWKTLQIHAGTTNEKIVNFIDKINNEVEEKEKEKEKEKKEKEKEEEEEEEKELTWIFFDEINTCNALGLITEIMCNHTYLGKKINENIIFIAACNPYRLLTKKMKESGLVYYNMKEDNKLNNLVYTVNPIPHSLLNFVFDFGSLRKEDEIKYISNTIYEKVSAFRKKHLIGNINENELKDITNDITESIVICHDFLRNIFDKSSVSMREIRRFGLFFEFFMKYLDSDKKIQYSLNMTLYLCYYLRLNDKNDRKELAGKLNKYSQDNNFLKYPEAQVNELTKLMYIEKSKGIALNRALKENLFTIYICITNKIPLIIVGKPGTSKSLSFQIVYNTMKGKYSENEFFKNKGKLYRYYYQGSETSTAEGIEQVFDKAIKAQKNVKNNDIINLVFFDEMGLAERSSNNPLKVIHYLLEKDQEDSVPFLGISNWKLDASKINRTLNLSITDYDIDDLNETAISIAEALNGELSSKYKEFFECLTKTYNEYIRSKREDIQENRDFHGNRDFYNLIKNAMRELIQKKKVLKVFETKDKKKEKNLLIRIGIESLERNFGGLEDSIDRIKNIFKNIYKTESFNLGKSESKLENIIEKNLNDSNSRYLMIISEGNDGSDIIKYLLESKIKKEKDKCIELVGSKYKKDIKSGKYSEEILNKIKYLMEKDFILILKDLDMIYASLYDLFNQNFTVMGDKQFARIAFEYSKISSEVNKNFHVIIIVDNNKIQELKLDPPFLNRFEKHLINFRMLIKEKDKEIANKINEYIAIISSYNNNKNLKLDLGKLLINCEQNNIEGLIYKIENKEEIPESIADLKYEKILIELVFNTIAPIFCQDIIASILSSNYDPKYHLMNEIIIKAYKKYSYINFELFFEKIEKKKNIIYTFSKDTENLFDKNQTIKNKFGNYSKSSVKTQMIESIKSENDLIILLKEFFNSNNKNLLILRFTENDLYIVNYANYIINNFEKENKNKYKDKTDKLIIFIIHMQRHKKSLENKKINSDLITLFNDEYYQIFIDNLNGKKDKDFCEMISNEANDLTLNFNKYTNEEFVDNNIYNILNYLNYKIWYQTEDLNFGNLITNIKDKIINNRKLKKLILKNLKEQAKSIKDIINIIFTSEISQTFEEDFIEVIDNKLNANFNLFLLNIIYYILDKHILIPVLNEQNLDKLLKDYYFENLINSVFDNVSFIFDPQLKLEIKANMVSIYNGLSIPQSKIQLDKIINYINEQICPSYIENEELMRKSNIKEEEISVFHEILERLERNIKFEINKSEFFQNFQNNNNLKGMLLEDYLKYFIIILFQKDEIDYKYNDRVKNFLKIIIKVKLGEENNTNYNFSNTIDEFIKIILFTQGYKNDIKNLFNTFIDIIKFGIKIEDKICQVLNQNIIKYEISERNKEYTKKVNISFFNIIESLSRAILLCSVDLLKKNKNEFYEFFSIFTLIEANLQKFNNKFQLYSKELGNLATIIKIQESYKYNNKEQFINNYENIINNLLKQSELLYNRDYNNGYDNILSLNRILNETFMKKGEEYSNLLIFIFRLQYKLFSDDEIKIKLIESFFKNPLLIKNSKIFLSETLKDMKPEIFDDNNSTENKTVLINNFMNLQDNQKLFKYKNLINQYNSINSKEFNELLLFTFENQCQSYFMSILKNNNNQYTEKACQELLLDVSLEYLKKAIKYLYNYYINDMNDNNDNINNTNNENINNTNANPNINNDNANANNNNSINNNGSDNNNNNLNINMNNIIIKEKNNLLKLYAIAYIKTYYYYYVEINYNHFDKCNFEQINNLFNIKNEYNKYIRNIINIYIWRLYSKKFENFEEFKNFNFTPKNIPIYKELSDELKETNDKCAFKENFIANKSFENFIQNYFKMLFFIQYEENDIELNIDEINSNFDSFYCALVNLVISNLYGNKKNIIINKMKFIYNLTKEGINLGNEGKTIYEYLLNNELFETNIIKKLSDSPLIKEDFEILLYSFRFILNVQMNDEQCFFNDLLKENANQFIKDNFIPGLYPIMDEYMASYNNLKGKFKLNESYSNLNIITLRFLNFILYSYLLSAYILNHLKKDQIKPFLIENLSPNTLFGVVKKAWELLNNSLIEKGIENAQIFVNMIFDKIIDYMNPLEKINTQELLVLFEEAINNLILEIISDSDKINQMNNYYHNLQDKILKSNPQNIKEIIQCNYEPSIYPQSTYPNIQYFYTPNIQFLDLFIQKFNSCSDNQRKYTLINLLINEKNTITENAMLISNLNNINKLANLLLNIYSYKISRDDAKKRKLSEELSFIMNNYNKIYNSSIDDVNAFTNKYINPFIKSWNQIKDKLIKYNENIIVDKTKGENSLEISIANPISNFLVEDDDKDGGLFLASAYENMIEWQNQFLDEIISNNNTNGILNSYIYQLEKEINIQNATEDEIININDNTKKIFYDLILSSSMRNIFDDKNDKINYRNYNDIIYDYDLIEEELGKIILPGLKKFKKGKIKFITFLYEGFRRGNSNILIEYSNKYKQRELNEKERNCIDALKENKNYRVYNDIFSSLQILMNEIIKENYDQNYLLYDIIKKLPKYIILNEDIIKLMDDNYNDKNCFTINSLVSFFEYFEDLCWNQIKKYIPSNYQLEINDNIKQYISNYFNNISQSNKINKKNFTTALRKLISRSIAGSRQDIDMKSDLKLKMYIKREDLWNNNLLKNKWFNQEIDTIFKEEILVGHCWKLYNLLEGENNTLEEIQQGQRNQTNNNNINNNENAQNNGNANNTNTNNEQNQGDTAISSDSENANEEDE